MLIECTLNGVKVQFDVSANTRLVEVLRNNFSLNSVKCSCLQGYCGACTVLLDDEPLPSCMVPIVNVHNRKIITLEYFSTAYESEYKRIMQGFKKANVKMCGFCNAGKIFTAYKILKMAELPTEKKLKELFEGQVCRCSVANSLVSSVKKM